MQQRSDLAGTSLTHKDMMMFKKSPKVNLYCLYTKQPQQGSGHSPDLRSILDKLIAQKMRLQMLLGSRFSTQFSFWCCANLRFLGGAWSYCPPSALPWLRPYKN